MKKTLILVLAAVLVVSVAGCNRKPKTSCLYGDKIPANILEQVEPLGEEIAMDLEKGEYDKIYGKACKLFQDGQTPEQFNLIIKSLVANLGQPEFTRLSEAYYLTNKAGKKYTTVDVKCNLDAENVNDTYRVPRNSEVVSLIYSTMTAEHPSQVFLELVKEDKTWKLLSITMTPSTIKGLTLEQLVEQARKSREAGRLRLASLYYRYAYMIADLSPNVDEYVSQKIKEEAAQVKTDYLPSSSPQKWDVGKRVFVVYNVDVFLAKGEPWVNIDWLTESLDDTQALETQSNELLDFAFEKFPEYGEFFKGIIVNAHSTNPKLASQQYSKLREFAPASTPKPAPAPVTK
jgi:hypothetical protein